MIQKVQENAATTQELEEMTFEDVLPDGGDQISAPSEAEVGLQVGDPPDVLKNFEKEQGESQ